jgi:hypothetical protein
VRRDRSRHEPAASRRRAASRLRRLGASHVVAGFDPVSPRLGQRLVDDPWTDAVRTNVRRTIEQLLTWSMPIRRRVDAGELAVVGAIYHVETGEVEFLDQPDLGS